MLNSIRGRRGMAVAPHALAAQAALDILRDGGNAVEGMIAAAATIAVVYPHMNSIGGDSFWLISTPGADPVAIDACGAAGTLATREWYAQQGITGSIPFRGGVAANTVAGTISGWDKASEYSQSQLRGKLPLSRLLADAIDQARSGIAVTRSQFACTTAKLSELVERPGFARTFLVDGSAPATGSLFRQPALAATLEQLARSGLRDFYAGDLAQSIAQDLATLGSPVTKADLARHEAKLLTPLLLRHSLGTVYNMTPPTQGVVSLMILGILDRLNISNLDPLSADYVHLCVEATKQAFKVRDAKVTDPAFMIEPAQALLDASRLDALAANVNRDQAAPWGKGRGPGDTIWMGVADAQGTMVSFIQSIYHEFGAGIILPGSGINWQNRGCSFSLDPGALNALSPGRKPFHTLNPALARFADQRTMVYGTMGGDGQPQTQAAVFTRIAAMGMDPQSAINAPRWLLGRTWGQTSESLKLESRFPDEVGEALSQRGHAVEILRDWDETMGHAGAIIRHPNGIFEGGADPRSDGGVAAF
jgi:oxamate amidohydrolase